MLEGGEGRAVGGERYSSHLSENDICLPIHVNIYSYEGSRRPQESLFCGRRGMILCTSWSPSLGCVPGPSSAQFISKMNVEQRFST